MDAIMDGVDERIACRLVWGPPSRLQKTRPELDYVTPKFRVSAPMGRMVLRHVCAANRAGY